MFDIRTFQLPNHILLVHVSQTFCFPICTSRRSFVFPYFPNNKPCTFSYFLFYVFVLPDGVSQCFVLPNVRYPYFPITESYTSYYSYFVLLIYSCGAYVIIFFLDSKPLDWIWLMYFLKFNMCTSLHMYFILLILPICTFRWSFAKFHTSQCSISVLPNYRTMYFLLVLFRTSYLFMRSLCNNFLPRFKTAWLNLVNVLPKV